ncbi:MAG: GTP 3',8-cyclase MoaA, partial [Peptostreptococcales bacterium]
MRDLFLREINYLRISVTDLCNLRCKYCMPESGISKTKHSDILTLEEIEEIAKAFVGLGINKIRITGGEPLVRHGILHLVQKIAQIKGVSDLAMTTNGLLLKSYAKGLKEAGLTRVNISLDTLQAERYSDITRKGQLKDVLEGIEEAKRVGLKPIKLNVVLMGGFNEDEIETFVNLTKNEEIDVRFIELMPTGEATHWALHHFIPNATVLEKMNALVKVEDEDISSAATYYRLPESKGRVGLINPIS